MTPQELKLNYSLNNIDNILSLPSEIKSKLLLDLLEDMSCDKNSSTFREGVTLGVLGKTQSKTKLGYDSEDESIEVKPKNLNNNSNKKFDGSGNFSDFTWARHNKYLSDDVKMIVSGFFEGKLIFVLSFNYSSLSFVKEVERQLSNRLPNGDEVNQYVRSIKFSYLHYKDSPSFKIEFLSPSFNTYESKFTKPFFNVITNYESDK